MNASSSFFLRRLVGNRSLYTATTRYTAGKGRMSERGNPQVWDSSKGIVFSGEGRGSSGVARGGVRAITTSSEIGEGEMETKMVERGVLEQRVEEGPVVVEKKVEVAVEKAVVKTETGQEDGQQKTENGEEAPKELTAADLTPPYTPLDFKIPEDVFAAAKKAPEGSPESFWNYQMYQGPNKERVKVHYCVSPEVTDRVIQRYFLNEPLLGFDLEWAADALPFHGPRRNVSLIQISSPTRIALFHVALYPRKKEDSLSSPFLKKILEDPNITKVGVWVVGDANKVQKYLNITPRGIFELSHLYKLVKYCESGEHSLINKRLVSLGKQAEEVLKLPLYKEPDVRTSDWTKSLTLAQIKYSASDAYAGVQIYSMLNHQRLQLSPCPPLPHHAELKLPISLGDHAVLPPSTESDEIEMTPAEAVPKQPKKTRTPTAAADKKEKPAAAPKKEKPAAAPKKEKHPLFAEADIWAAQYRVANPCPEDNPTTAAKHYEVRMYYLWHRNPDLDVPTLCAIPRDPPLQLPSVVAYILRAIRRERLPYNKTKLIELLEAQQRSVPASVRFGDKIFLERLKREVERGEKVLKEPSEGNGQPTEGQVMRQAEMAEEDIREEYNDEPIP
ncbi:putative Werner syndrome ATP-dependent helicase [Triangularia verruculosa]|uniref:Werner syndrome ATP-dependent helicase n=1 Tax=Triangularia verruculosa TaxID=2587418 RepID=A0AAN6XQ85_9PEZI|nr:putative Werner syndrome ATP-dependent helicase [Triangularia verruculosa]